MGVFDGTSHRYRTASMLIMTLFQAAQYFQRGWSEALVDCGRDESVRRNAKRDILPSHSRRMQAQTERQWR